MKRGLGVGEAEVMGALSVRGGPGAQGSPRADVREYPRVLTSLKFLPKASCRSARSCTQKVLDISQD